MWRRALPLLLIVLPLLAFSRAPGPEELGRRLGLADPEGFAATVLQICRHGRLPERYLTKDEARAAGWRPGRDLCEVAPGRALGGDRFGNREGLLPDRPGRVWFEADLDHACGRRGPRRLVFSNDRLIFVTLDHYRSFEPVPCPQP
jgi:hypothetical protein